MAGRETVILCQEAVVALTLARAEALFEVVVGIGLVLGLAPHLVTAVDACGDEARVGQVHGAHPVTGVECVSAEVLVPVDEPHHEHLLRHVDVDEEVDPLSYCAPAARLERKVVALGDDDAGSGDDAPSRYRLAQVPSIDRDEDLMGAVGSHPVQRRQVALDVERVRGALAVAAPQVVQDGVGQVEAIHGDEPGEEVSLLEPAFQVGGDR